MADTILTRFDELNTWKQGDQRAPHKPLLVLYALGHWKQCKAEVTFIDAEPDLTALLREFGPPRKSDHPEQPFWRLQRKRKMRDASANPFNCMNLCGKCTENWQCLYNYSKIVVFPLTL
jgi:predicted restriction endonuclease